MTVELTMLLYSVGLTVILILIPATLQVIANGLVAQASNRDDLPEPSVMSKRAQRLSANMLENMMLFAPLILIANAVGVSTEWTVLGAQMFFFSRIIHAVIYLAGWPVVRPIFWTIGLIGTLMVLVALL